MSDTLPADGVRRRGRRDRQQRRRRARHVHGQGLQRAQFDPDRRSGRQTGSSFKGITLATALDAGYSPNDRVERRHAERSSGPASDCCNLDCSGGTLTLTDAIAKSDNCAFVRTDLSLGPGHYGDDGAQRVVDMAGRLGIDTSQARAPVPVDRRSAREHARRSTWRRRTPCFANDGVHRTPRVHHQDRGSRRQGDLPGRHCRAAGAAANRSRAPRPRCSRT